MLPAVLAAGILGLCLLTLVLCLLLFRQIYKGFLIMSNTLSEATGNLHTAVDATVAHEKQDAADNAALTQQLSQARLDRDAAVANAATPEAIAAIDAEIDRLNTALNPPAAGPLPGTESEPAAA